MAANLKVIKDEGLKLSFKIFSQLRYIYGNLPYVNPRRSHPLALFRTFNLNDLQIARDSNSFGQTLMIHKFTIPLAARMYNLSLESPDQLLLPGCHSGV